jgi:uncharacterized protein
VRRLALSVFIVSMILGASIVRAQDALIPPTAAWVTDRGDMLSAAEERLLAQRLAGYADTTSTQIVVVTLPDLQGADPVEVAVELGRQWGVGQAGQDNGIVILLSRDDRTITISVGYGLEGAIPDAVADRIRRNIMVPLFREGRFYDGLSAGVDALISAARGEFRAETTARRPQGGGMDAATLFVVLIILFFVISAARKGGGGSGGGRPRRHRSRIGGPPVIIWGGGGGWGSGNRGGFGGGGFGGGGFGGFGGGGGSFGGGGASGRW